MPRKLIFFTKNAFGLDAAFSAGYHINKDFLSKQNMVLN